MPFDFRPSPEQQQVQTSVQRLFKPFVARQAELRQSIVYERKFPHEIWQAVSEAGYMGAIVPEKYGGSDTGIMTMVSVVEEMARLGFGNAIMVLTAMDAACIARTGPDAVREKFLPGIATGEHKFCFALTESNAGTNTFRIETFAEERGNTFVVNGTKTYITGADVADYMLLVTRTIPRQECEQGGVSKAYGMSIFVVDANAKGITKTVLPTRGIEGMNQFSMVFDNVEIPKENLVGDLHQGAMPLFLTLNPERILAASMVTGVVDYCLKIACDYAHERKVFKDKPIGAYQSIQHPLADAKIRQEAVRLTTYKAAWAFDNDVDGAEAGHLANCAKYLAAELGIDIVDRALETLGGNGFSDEYGIIHLWDTMRLFKTAPISKEMILNYVAEHTLGLPRSY